MAEIEFRELALVCINVINYFWFFTSLSKKLKVLFPRRICHFIFNNLPAALPQIGDT